MLLVHGMGDDSSIWVDTVAALADDFSCTTVDLPGHGRSPAPTDPAAYERAAVLESLDAVLEQIGPALLIGHSLGGYLALAHHITRHTTRPGTIPGMVLISAGPGFRDADSMARWNSRVHANAPNLSIAPVAATISLHVDSLVMDRLDEVTIPVGLVVGSEDRNFLGANDYLENKLTQVQRLTIGGGRHRIMRTHPGEVAAMVHDTAAAAGLVRRT